MYKKSITILFVLIIFSCTRTDQEQIRAGRGSSQAAESLLENNNQDSEKEVRINPFSMYVNSPEGLIVQLCCSKVKYQKYLPAKPTLSAVPVHGMNEMAAVYH
ncbi:hypothetical protein [Breznakiella homolactica]|uniref:Uncharacterized protein n=1 Tax=Breznakiella homolactica TaxID=2798577 RepID=A0A7T7XMT4_9SPIR|nr:hypothetical protein [Breznakiella homolactica]QQO09162.1 hypothetical protein JFL75_19890 [Breznakiella homolactica]